MLHKSASSSCSSASPPMPAVPQHPVRSTSTCSNVHSTPTPTLSHPSIIPLEYDYQTMSPSSFSQLHRDNISTSTNHTYNHMHHHLHHQHQYSSCISSARPLTNATTTASGNTRVIDVDIELDNQYSSLFGDPVPPPPPPDFISTPPQLIRPVSLDISSGDEDGFGRTILLDPTRPTQSRLFSNVPFSSTFSRRISDTSTQRNFDVLPTPMPRLQPPDIQILPNSSGGSSSEAHDSPNYALLTPNDIPLSSTLYNINEPTDVSEIVETMTISDATGTREYSEATRRVSNFSEDFKSNVGALSNQASEVSVQNSTAGLSRQFSNESYSSNEWFRPATHDYPEFSKIPRLRPSSKNVMSIKRDEMPMHQSPVAAMINDSNGSSSGEERLLNITQTLDGPSVPLDSLSTPPARPPDPSPTLLREMEADLLLTPQSYLLPRRRSSTDSLGQHFPTPPPPAAPPPDKPTPVPEGSESSMKREMSPVILKDSISTGSEHRVDQTRLHKKTSFTIITEKSPQSSRVPSPASLVQSQQRSPSKASIPSSSFGTKPVAKPRYHLQRKSLSSTQLRLPQLPQLQHQLPSDDSPRPSVQFNMSGRYTPSKMPQRGILHNRESLTSSQETPLLPHSTALTPKSKRRESILPPPAALTDGIKIKSYEALPLITDPYRTAIPRLNRSSFDLRERESAVIPPGALPRPLKPNPNPTRKQKGLLRIMNGDMSHIPLRSNWASMDDLSKGSKGRPLFPTTLGALQKRRRSSSTSPERRSSTQTASDRRSSNLSSITTSDFSYRRPSVLPQPQPERRKSIAPMPSPKSLRRQSLTAPSKLISGRTSRTKISKPTTLSPIIGTPNKDSSAPQSPMHGSLAASETPSEANSRRDSLSKIPVRAGNSRSSSPLKEFTAQLPLSGHTSVANSSRTASRATFHTDSRATSRASSHPASRPTSRPPSRSTSRPPSRSTSRASTRPISRAASRAASRASTRPNSRMETARTITGSRPDSRLSMNSLSARPESISPSAARSGRSDTGSPVLMRRRKSISLSPKASRRTHTRRQSLSPPHKKRSGSRGRGKKALGSTGSRRNSQSRIPLRASSGATAAASPTKSKPPGAPRSKPRSPRKPPLPESARRGSSKKRKSSPQMKSASAKKSPKTVSKRESSVKGPSESASKQPGLAIKREGSNLQKGTFSSNMKREASNLQQKSTKSTTSSNKPVRREATTASSKKPATVATATAPKGGLKRQPSTKSIGKTAEAKGATGKAKAMDGKVSDGTEKTNAQVTESARAGADVTKPSNTLATTAKAATPTPSMPAGATSGGSGSTTSLRRHPSNASLVRMTSKMSLFSVKRSDSNLSKKTTVSAVAEEPSSTTSATNGNMPPLNKINSRGQLMTPEEVAALPAAILEKSQKTLENIQKTVIVATDEIQKKIHENLSDLKTLESDMGRLSDSAGSPTSSVATVVENKKGQTPTVGESVSRTGTAEGATAKGQLSATGSAVTPSNNSPLPSGQPIEAEVSVLNAPQAAHISASATASTATMEIADAAAERNFVYDVAEASADSVVNAVSGARLVDTVATGGGDGDGDDDIKRRSPDGQGGSAKGSGNGSREFLKVPDDDSTPSKGCCRCCTRFCMPCRRSRCCRRNKSPKPSDESEEPVLSATSSATTTNLEVIDEVTPKDGTPKTSCWQKLNCCKRCRKKPKVGSTSPAHKESTMTAGTAMPAQPASPAAPIKQRGCGLCLSKMFCCRRINKVDPITGNETELKKCCFCIPCRRKQSGHGAVVGSTSSQLGSAAAWEDPELGGITAGDASVLEGAREMDGMPKQGCCKRFWGKLFCCRRKQAPKPSESRRASMRAPPPPAEDTRRKLHVDLVEYNSKMKGAIPVLPLYLAWFCAICNTVFPGLGTLLSGLFCICVGIPRFSQYDSAKARFGSLIINIIVAVSQLFCVLFCFVGWGWSIWWGTIMLKCAKKLSKIKKVERLELEEEKRQAEAAAAMAAAARTAPITTTTALAAETEAA